MLISYQSLGHVLLGSQQSHPLLCKQSQKRYVSVITTGWKSGSVLLLHMGTGHSVPAGRMMAPERQLLRKEHSLVLQEARIQSPAPTLGLG